MELSFNWIVMCFLPIRFDLKLTNRSLVESLKRIKHGNILLIFCSEIQRTTLACSETQIFIILFVFVIVDHENICYSSNDAM